MRILDLIPGSEEWIAAGLKYHRASEAPMMMGVSRHVRRNELLAAHALGQEREFSDWVRKHLLDKGHEIEAQARAIVEARIGEDLYPVVGLSDCGKYMASFDGLTIDGTQGWECKSWNQDLVAQLGRGELADEYRYQLEHQILVGGLESVLFTVSDGTEERTVSVEYRSDPTYRARLIAGWQQFEEDLAAYQHVEVIQAPVAKPVASLPSLYIEITGEVTASNLAAYREAALELIESVNTDLQTDQDFADAEGMVKLFDEAEKKVRLVKEQSLQKTASIAEAMRTMDDLAEAMRAKRLYLNKHVSERKLAIRDEIRLAGVKAFAAHIASLNERLGKPYMPDVKVDFAGAMRNKRTVASLREAVNKALLDGKLEANAIADKIAANLKVLEERKAHAALFADAHTLVQMDPQGFAAVVENRIREHEAKEAKRLEDERARIQREEEAKAQAKAKAEAEALAEQSREKIRAEVKAEVRAEVKAEVAAATKVTPAAKTASHVPPRPLPTPARAAPPRDEILLLVAEKYSVPKTLAERWMRELFAGVEA